jgi:hypothetical protein|tara:strand:+ start:4810 stop:4959 length:150 start_codon:yes stop_codon:yes gene_type:complete
MVAQLDENLRTIETQKMEIHTLREHSRRYELLISVYIDEIRCADSVQED